MSSTTLSATATHEVEHTVDVDAPAGPVFALLADVAAWPTLFPPTVYIAVLDRDGTDERIRFWATANGEAKTWTSRRTLDRENLRIDFRQERSQAPVAAMGGAWIVEPVGDEACRVRLLHDFAAVDEPGALDWVEQAVDRNSRSELAALKENAERALRHADLLMTFADSVTVAAAPREVYDFVNEADRWSERLPHVASVTMTEDTPGLQVLTMDTQAKDGSTHTTSSVRVTFPDSTIVYKQTQVPPLMTLHTGRWTFEPVDDEGTATLATSEHTVAINESRITEFLGSDAGVAEAREYLRTALGTNSRATLEHARAHAEGLIHRGRE